MRFHITNDINDEVAHKSLPPGKNPVKIGSASGNDVVLNTNFIDDEAGWLYNDGDGAGWKFWPASDGWMADDIPLRQNTPVVISSGQTLSCYPCHLTLTLSSGDEVMTTGGIFGTITNVKDDRFIIRIAENTKIEVAKSFVSAVVSKSGSDKK